MNKIEPLTPAAFYVLLSLHQSERHGYEIMKQVEADSAGKIKIGPGTLYGVVKRTLSQGLIEESDVRPDPAMDDERRRYYRLTTAGRERLGLELQRYEDVVLKARNLGVNYKVISLPWAN